MKNIKKYLSAAAAAFILCSAVTCHGISAADLASVSQGEVARYIVIGGVFIALIGVLLLLFSFLKPKKKDYDDDFFDDYDDFNDRKKPSKHSEGINAEIAQGDDEPVDSDNTDTESESANSDNSDDSDDSDNSDDSDTADGDEAPEDINADNGDAKIGNEDVLDDESESEPDNAETEGTEQEIEEPGEPEEKVRLTLGGMNSDDVRIVEFSDKATIGRRSTNSVVISDNAVSGEHCRLTYSDGKVIVEDMGSTNGTVLNGEKITVSEIKNGDVLILGKTKYKISFSLINE